MPPFSLLGVGKMAFTKIIGPILVLSQIASSNYVQIEERAESAHSPPFYPSPWMNPEAIGWEEAYVKAKDFVSQLTLLEKVNLTTGVGYVPPPLCPRLATNLP